MKFKQFLEERKLTISTLAKECGIAYSTLYTGIENPESLRAGNLKKIAQYLEISMDELYDLLREVEKKTLLDYLREQKSMKLKGSIYHYTQINFTYNSNRIEGSKLTEDETRYIFETNTLFRDKGSANVDDIVETANHFLLFDRMLDEAQETLSEKKIKEYHKILKAGTSDSRLDWFRVGEYKSLPNEVGGKETAAPEKVAGEIAQLLKWYNGKKEIKLEDIIEFHYRFESIHPFQDGNGRIGRIIMFRECLKNNIVPFIIEDSFKGFYYRGLSEYEREKGYLVETCLAMQDKYRQTMEKYSII